MNRSTRLLGPAALVLALAVGCSTATADDGDNGSAATVAETRVLPDIEVPEPPVVAVLYEDPTDFGSAEFEAWWDGAGPPILELTGLLDTVSLAMPLPGESDEVEGDIDIGAFCEAAATSYEKALETAFPAPIRQAKLTFELAFEQIGDGIRQCLAEPSTDQFLIGAAVVPDYLDGRFQLTTGVQGMGETAGLGSTFELPRPGEDTGIQPVDPED